MNKMVGNRVPRYSA